MSCLENNITSQEGNMKFPNAFNGSKKILLAEILALIAAVLVMIAGITLGGTIANAVETSNGDAVIGGAIGAGALILVGGIAAIVAFVVEIIGINACAKDDPSFKTALYAILAGIVASVISSATSKGDQISVVSEIFSVISSIASLAATVLVIKGFITLANRLDRSDVAASGNTTLYICVAASAVSIIASIIGVAAKSTAIPMAIISGVASIASLVIFILFLNKSKEMLAA